MASLKQDVPIGENLKRLRRKCGLTQREASAQMEIAGVDITEDILAKMEQGRYSIRVSALLAMKKIYRVESFDAFFEGLG